MIFKIFVMVSLFTIPIAAQHCSSGARGFRTVVCFHLNSPYLSRAAEIETSKYLYQSFKCINCKLGVIQPNSFNVGSREKCTFRSMNFEANGITEIKPHGFGYQGQVRKLTLRNNLIKVLYASNFVDLTYLEYLDLSSNFIQKLATNTFQGLNYLKFLDLENNNISLIDNYAFRDLEELEVLNLKRNKLVTLLYGMFFGATHVNSLSFAYNSISFLDNQALTSLSLLQKLDLSHNRLTQLPPELHAISKTLNTLDLSHNNLSVINITSDTIEELKLANVSLHRIETQLRCILPSLQSLDLQLNNISIFNIQSFAEFPLLRELNLSRNAINEIHSSGKMQLRSLKHLQLSSNNLTSFDYQEVVDFVPQLSYINLKQNPLSCSFKNEVKEYFEAVFVKIDFTPEKCRGSVGISTTSVVPIQDYTADYNKPIPINDVLTEKECKCSCTTLSDGILITIVVMFAVILLVSVSSLCTQCCCRSRVDKYSVSSANLPLVNLSKD